MTLVKYLMERGIVTGPLEKNTSYSGLEVIKKYLLGLPQFHGGEKFLLFGVALHEVFLENKFDAYNKLSRPDQEKILKMVNVLKAHHFVAGLMKDSIREQKLYGDVHYANLALILDAKQPKLKRGFDLKTTSCRNIAHFKEKLVEYGYVKQALIYVKVTGLKEFYFVAIRKEEPYEIFIVDVVKEFRKECVSADDELQFLTYFYKHYGKIIDNNKPTIPMSKSPGAELINTMLIVLKERNELKKANKENEKVIEKKKKEIIRLSNKITAKERPLFQEKIDRIISAL
jgi:hypothetical protein